MRKSRFSEEQIIAILKESEAGVETGGVQSTEWLVTVYKGINLVGPLPQ